MQTVTIGIVLAVVVLVVDVALLEIGRAHV